MPTEIRRTPPVAKFLTAGISLLPSQHERRRATIRNKNRIAFSVSVIAITLIFCTEISYAGDKETVLQARSVFKDCAQCPQIVIVPPGQFNMGSLPNEISRDIKPAWLAVVGRWLAQKAEKESQPKHVVHIDYTFGIGQNDITLGEFAVFVNETGYSINPGCTIHINNKYVFRTGYSWRNPGFVQNEQDPVVCVSWEDAKKYVDWLNDKFGDKKSPKHDGPYRLPSDAEWEYVARAGQDTTRWWGDSIGANNANCKSCGSTWDGKGTSPVGSFPSNSMGVYDILGNVWQWTEDCWNENFEGAPFDGSSWKNGNCNSHVVRGGSWLSDPWVLRSALRSSETNNERDNDLGFRVARMIP